MADTPTPQDPLARLIYFAAQDIHNLAQKILLPFDITLEQFHIVKALSLDDGQSQCQLCHTTNKTATNMTRLLDRLEKKGLLTRQANPDDRRSAIITITDKGRGLVGQIRPLLESFSHRLTACLSTGEEKEMRHALGKIAATLQTIAIEPITPPDSGQGVPHA